MQCPECNSEGPFYRDGLRYYANGASGQRWLCHTYGYRFSEPNVKRNVLSQNIEMFKSEADHFEKRIVKANFASQAGMDSLPFSSSEDFGSHKVTTVGKRLKAFRNNNSKRQVCALNKKAKNLDAATETNTVAGESSQQDSKGKIVEYSFWLLRQGYSHATIKSRVKRLNRLVRLGADFNDSESVKEIIAKQEWSISSRVNAVDAYDSLLKMLGRTWTPPIYKRVRQLPFIPTETELDQLIAGCSRKMGTFLQLLKETGMRCGEACQLKWSDIDLVGNSVRVTPEKGGNPRNLRISNKLVSMLNETSKDKPYVFTHNADVWIRNFSRQRKRIAAKLKNIRLIQITFHTFRHWKATMEYHKTKDILHVKELLGHKSINNTLLYTQLVTFADDEFTAKVAHSEKEACELIETGFEYVCDFDGSKLFRKRR